MSERKPLIAANWKMHKNRREAVSFTEELQARVGPLEDREVLLAPPFTALWAVKETLKVKGFALAAQNSHYEEKGAFTGEISVAMAKDCGCDYVILGHSERRHVFGETDSVIRKKVGAVIRSGLRPILCVGEVLNEREEGRTFTVVRQQIEQGMAGLEPDQVVGFVIAYEPVWAIGTGKTATPAQAQEVHAFIRELLGSFFDKRIAKRTRILYGGSVKPDNVDSLMGEADIDGLLVGGASLEVESFQRIVEFQN